MENGIKGYKVADSNGQCRGYQFEVGKRYKHDGEIKICNTGFHFCIKASHCFNYYDFSPNNKVFEVIGYGEYQTKDDDSKVCVGDIEIIRELTWQEVLMVSNDGINNTGYSNSGNSNSGNSNSGNSNSGNSNSGYKNSGDSNSGDSNSGDSNSGYKNSGNYNSGYKNSGNSNSGNSNSGYKNSGDSNSGDSNSGNYNSGHKNSGDSNSGYKNSGNYNSGDSNSGNYNSGDSNSGNYNSGNYNSGDRNCGIFNSNTPNIRMFNQDSNWTWNDYYNSKVYSLIKNLSPCIWISSNNMSDDEKKLYPKHETTGGYLKQMTLKDAWTNLWNNLPNEDKEEFYKLPNFNWDIFTEITSIKKN